MKQELSKRNDSSSKKKVKIVKLSSKKPNNSLNFSQSLYLSKFVYNRLKKIQDIKKAYINRSALIVPKNFASFYDTNRNIIDKNNINKFQKTNYVYINNYFQILKQSKNYSTNPNSCKNKNNDIDEHNLLYENNLKLQNYINKLQSELLFLKSMCVKKDDEIKEFSKYVEEAKFLKKSNKNKFMLMILKGKQILKLKDNYENIKMKLREEIDLGNSLINKTKGINFDDFSQDIEEDINILKEKIVEFKARNGINEELQKVVQKSNWKKDKFLENYKLLNDYKMNINNKIMNIEALNEKAYDIRQKCSQIKMEKFKMLRFNKCIKKNNIRLVNDKKVLKDYFIKREKIEKKIISYQKKTRDLMEQIREKEHFIKKILISRNSDLDDSNSYYEYSPKIEQNPKKNEDNQVVFYESLIKESKERQNKLVILLNDLINKNNYVKNNNYNKKNENNDKKSDYTDMISNYNDMKSLNNDKISIDNNNNDKKTNDIINDNDKKSDNKDISKLLDDNSKIFDENIINSDINVVDINIGLKDEKMFDFIFLLNIMFYIMNVTKEKILNILLNLKTENYYLGNLTEKENFISELSEEILSSINNTKDINNLKEILIYLLETKYTNDKIQFLDNVINEIYILNYNHMIFFNQEPEDILLEKIEIIYLNKISQLIPKINAFQQGKVLYEKLKQILIENNLYIKEDKEKIKLFQFFIYIVKKRENHESNNSLNEFDTKIITKFLNDINSKENEIKMKNKEFCEALKIWLKVNNTKLDKLIREKQTIKISEFVNILNKNNFEIENNNLSFDYFLVKYKQEEISEFINIDLLKNDLENV